MLLKLFGIDLGVSFIVYLIRFKYIHKNAAPLTIINQRASFNNTARLDTVRPRMTMK